MRKVYESTFRIRLMKGLFLVGIMCVQSLLSAQWGEFDGGDSETVTNDTSMKLHLLVLIVLIQWHQFIAVAIQI